MNNGNPYAATDLGIFRYDGERLLIFLVELGGGPFKGRLSLPGARLQMDEDLPTAAKRVYREAGGTRLLYMEQLYTFSALQRDPRSRSISTAYIAFPGGQSFRFKPCDKYAGGDWYDAFRVRRLAYDHDIILNVCRERIAAKLNYSTISLLLLPAEFTLTEMQKLYELCLDAEIDKRNFRKKIGKMDIVKETGRRRTGEKARPAMLYKAVRRSMELIPLFG